MEDILIGEGDDWRADYFRGFEGPMAVITAILAFVALRTRRNDSSETLRAPEVRHFITEVLRVP